MEIPGQISVEIDILDLSASKAHSYACPFGPRESLRFGDISVHGPKLADKIGNLLAIARPRTGNGPTSSGIKRQPSAQRTQAPESVDTPKGLPPLTH